MSRSISQPLLVLPALLLIFFVGLTANMEKRIGDNNESIRVIMNDGSTRLSAKLQDLIWHFHQNLDAYDPATGTAEQFRGLNDDLNRLLRELATTNAYFAAHPHEQEEHHLALGTLNLLRTGITQLQTTLPSSPRFPETVKQAMDTRVGGLILASHDFNNAITSTHREKIEDLLSEITQQEFHRFVLYALIIVCASILINVLLRNTRSYRRNAEVARAAEQANAMFAATLQSTTIGVLIRDARHPSQRVIFINQALTNMTGYDFADVINSHFGFLAGIDSDIETITNMREAIARHEATSFDLLTYRKDGSPFWGEWHLSPVADQDGKLAYYVSLLTDITDFRETQEALLAAKEQAENASKVKSNFLATMSHEIRTPINGLLGILNLLNDTPLDAEQKSYLNIARTSGNALNQIINDILDYSKIEAGKIAVVTRPFSLRSLLGEVIDLTQPSALEKSLILNLDVPAEVPDYLVSDAGRIRQILLNLVSNAIKFTDNGEVMLRVRMMPAQSDDIAAALRFEIIDTGIGIAEADQQKLFSDFSQLEPALNRRHNGTGLGLAITKRLAQLLDGEVGVESKLGAGSKFWFAASLPLASQAEDIGLAPINRLPANPCFKPGAYTVLVVEDNQTNQIVAGSYLEKAGYHVDIAATGTEAITRAAAHAYDLILMDISMPEMDGLEATRRIRALGGWASAVPIVALTAHVLPDDRDRCLASGMNDFLNKPIERELLSQICERWLAKPSQRQSPLSQQPVAAVDHLPVIDKKALRRLVDDLDAVTMFRITQTFLENIAERIEAMHANCELLAFNAIQSEAHALKGSSANCGLPRFSALMAEIERAASRRDCNTVSSLLQHADPACAAARESLVAERDIYRN